MSERRGQNPRLTLAKDEHQKRRARNAVSAMHRNGLAAQ
jgi:hypothetical protein